MNPAIPDDVDTELSRYLDAEEIGKAGVNPAVIKQKKVTYNKQRGVNEMFMPLPSGGYTKIGEEKVVDPVPPQDVGKPPPDQVFDQATASWQEPAAVAGGMQMSTQQGEDAKLGLPLELGGEPPAPEPSAFDGALSETVKGMVRGGLVAPSQFLKDNFGLYDPLVVQIVDPETGEFSPGLKILSRQEKEDLDRRMAAGELPYAYDFEQLVEMSPEAGGGAQALGGLAQFVGAYAGLGKLFTVGKGIIAQGASRGFAADFLGFQGDDGRITDLLLEMGVPDNMVTDFLRTDPNDPDYVGRFKNALEALPIGVLAESIGPMYRAVREGAPLETIRQSLTQLRSQAADAMANQIKAAEERIAREGSTLYSNPVGPVVDRALAAAGRLVGTGEAVQAPSLGGLPGRISTRFPTAAKATEDPYTGELVIGYDELKQDPKVYEFNVNITRDYPNMRPQPGATTDETSEQFITHVKDNLLYLHDQVPAATRKRSQLWYDGARNITDRWSQEYGVPDTSIAGALAALSPQKDWYQNVSLAQRVLDVVKPKGGTPAAFTPEMEKLFFTLKDQKGQPVFNKPKYVPLLDAIRGKSYDQITDPDPAVQNTLRALFVRLHDQTYTPPAYRIVSPEGDFLDVATNLDGSPSRVAWGSLNEISKAIGAIEANGDVRTISGLMGERHKVRNFYNNIYDPNSPYGDVTIDTHAVAAGLLRPLSGNSLEVDHNFKNTTVAGRGTTKGSSISGVSGNYGLYAEAYRRAAQERGILPRQMQSITWEAVRGLFPDTFKTERNAEIIDGIWSRYRNGEIEIDEARRIVSEAAGGINPPTWQQ